MSIFSKLIYWGKDGARAEALKLGIMVEEVERDLPFFTRGNKSVSVEQGQCVKYSVRRISNALPPTWSFLQRTEKGGDQYSNGWLFVSPQGGPPLSLDRVLKQIASDWEGELLEFEATPSQISAFWEEWGGAKMVGIIFKYLQELSQV